MRRGVDFRLKSSYRPDNLMTAERRVRSSHLSRRPGVALYAAVQEEVERLIASGGLAPGDPLPTEAELQERFGVSRATVRQALQGLEHQGAVERRQGRGTFVAYPAMERVLPELTGFTEHIRSRGMRSRSRLVDYSTVVASASNDSRQYPAGTPLARVVRVRYADSVVIACHSVYLPVDIATSIGFSEEVLRSDETTSLYELFALAGLRLAWADERLQARGADRAEAELLGVRSGTPVMSVLRATHDTDDRLIEIVRAVYLGDKYEYAVHLDREAGPGRGGLVTANTASSEEEKSA
jgi:GntR family transcriptional regulator